MRLFLAINLDAGTRREIAEVVAPLRTEAPGLAWTAEPRLHLTLRFLGEQEEADDVPARVARAMDGVAARHRTFPMHLRQVGAFPNFRRARVVWMGVEPAPRLELLHHDVELACDALGFGVEGRPFRPHVTVARVRERPDLTVLRALSRAARAVHYEREVMVQSVDLMRSAPAGGAGAPYERLHASPLGNH